VAGGGTGLLDGRHASGLLGAIRNMRAVTELSA